jgi:hypothetical protein
MRTFLHVAAGAFLCLIAGVGINAFLMMNQPYGAITNEDFPLIRINPMAGNSASGQYELRKGESKLLPYGQYTISIPDTKASFVLFKNNRGTCDIHSANGILLVETNRNAHIMGGAQ